jgi:hypothetical protein
MEPRKVPLAPPADRVIAETRAWLERAVIGLNLCPFARAVHVKRQIRYVVSEASTPAELLEALSAEMHALAEADPALVDTSLLIHPQVLHRFVDYNDFLHVADTCLADCGLEGVLQVASFHPLYRFAGTGANDVTNATNRSPYPMLHLLREASVDRAVAAVPDASAIYENNLATLRTLGPEGWAALQAQCRRDAAPGEATD